MFHTARIRLTILYSLIFLVLFWSLSGGIYFWMNHFFGDKALRQIDHYQPVLNSEWEIKEPPADIIMDQLRNIVVLVDFGLLLAVPLITWFLTGRTLAPVQAAHAREQQFLTDASHDLRTPLAIISADLELALRRTRTLAEYEKTLKSSKEEVDDLIALVENLLFINRDSQEPTAIREDVDLVDIISGRVSLLQKRAQLKRQTISLKSPTENKVIQGNSHLLSRLFSNLLDNAIKYSPERADIYVNINYDHHYANVIIINTGIGIPQKEITKIFDRFYRIDPSRCEKGYGLGLSIVKQIVDLHQGKINITSAQGRQTKVYVSLPFRQNPGKSLS